METIDDSILTALGARSDRLFLYSLEDEFKHFVNTANSDECIVFPTMTSYHRLLIHKVAERYGLYSESNGWGAERQTTVAKTDHPTLPCLSFRDFIIYEGTPPDRTSKKAKFESIENPPTTSPADPGITNSVTPTTPPTTTPTPTTSTPTPTSTTTIPTLNAPLPNTSAPPNTPVPTTTPSVPVSNVPASTTAGANNPLTNAPSTNHSSTNNSSTNAPSTNNSSTNTPTNTPPTNQPTNQPTNPLTTPPANNTPINNTPTPTDPPTNHTPISPPTNTPISPPTNDTPINPPTNHAQERKKTRKPPRTPDDGPRVMRGRGSSRFLARDEEKDDFFEEKREGREGGEARDEEVEKRDGEEQREGEGIERVEEAEERDKKIGGMRMDEEEEGMPKHKQLPLVNDYSQFEYGNPSSKTKSTNTYGFASHEHIVRIILDLDRPGATSISVEKLLSEYTKQRFTVKNKGNIYYAIFRSVAAAQALLEQAHLPLAYQLSQLTLTSTPKKEEFPDEVFYPRPETTARVARRLIGNALDMANLQR
eukprot:Phypoly_transcript_05450.p1 GENE.Phypoly_transcript_05450~~Phypoly_transcript_05450.p1  ORF type:complete len:536 (+),score=134.20 Phypoly_transcript_05450:170-1777(+)